MKTAGPSSQFALTVKGLSKTYRQGHWWQKQFSCRALDNVDFKLRRGSTLGVVGPSGSGKTTLAMCLTGLEQPDRGEILVNGNDLDSPPTSSRTSAHRAIQLIFQDSARALNPRMCAREIVEEPLLIRGENRVERWERAETMMERVGLARAWRQRLPHELSGGQRQRLAIARALLLRPQVLVLDEVFVGLDLSIQGQIANLLLELQEVEHVSYICISHDLGLVSHVADDILVMSHGQVVEQYRPNSLVPMCAPPPERSATAARSGA